MTHPRPLTALEVDTLRVALALLSDTHAASLDLVHARAVTDVSAIANDETIDRLLRELDGAEVSIRRAGP